MSKSCCASALQSCGLADARRADEQEDAERPVGGCSPARETRTASATTRRACVLADDLLRELRLEVHQLVALGELEARRRDPRRLRHHLRDVRRRHLLVEHHAAAVLTLRHGLPLLDLALEARQDGVRELARAPEVAVALRDREVRARLLQPLPRRLPLLERLALARPRRLGLVRLGHQHVELLLELLPPRGGEAARLAPERLELDLHRQHLALQVGDRLRLRLVLHAQPRRRLVEQVDRLVGELPLGQVAVRMRDGGDERAVGDVHAVVRLVLLLEAAQDRDRRRRRRLRHEHRLEAPRERRVLLDGAELGEGRRADARELAARERRLEQDWTRPLSPPPPPRPPPCAARR